MLGGDVEFTATNLTFAQNKIREVLDRVFLVFAEGIEFLQRNRILVEIRTQFLKNFRASGKIIIKRFSHIKLHNNYESYNYYRVKTLESKWSFFIINQ